MPLYAVLALCVAIFGGAHAAMAALRTFFDPHFKNTVQLALAGIKHVKDCCGLQSATGVNISDSEKKVLFWANAWNITLLVPSLAFAGFIFWVSIYVGANWDSIGIIADLKGPEYAFVPRAIIGYTLFNIALVIASGFIGWRCWSISQDAQVQAQTVVDAMKNQVNQIQPDAVAKPRPAKKKNGGQ